MSAIALVARRAFEFNGQSYVEGEALDAAPLEAVRLLNRRDVHLAPIQPKAPAPKPTRRYKRRDLTAESA